MKHTMENEYLRISVDDHGAELVSIYDKTNQRELLWQADPAFWRRHAPILFPHVGKHYNNEYHYNGQIYQTHQHGFARDLEFSCLSASGSSVTHRLTATEETKAYFPFDFSLDVTHTLHGRELTVTWEVVNRGTQTMYFTIGGHPAFRVPILPDTRQTDYCLLFDTDADHLNYLLLDPKSGTAVKDETYDLPLNHGRAAITSDMFDRDALVFDDSQIEYAAIGYPDGSPYLSVSCKGFPNFGIWSVPGAPYICLEPWIGRCDDFGFVGDLSERPGILSLPAEEVFRRNYTIKVHERSL